MPFSFISAIQRPTTGATAASNAAHSSSESWTCSLPLSVAILMPNSSAPSQMSPTFACQSRPEASSKILRMSSGRPFQRSSLMMTENDVVPRRFPPGPSIWYFVCSWIFSGGMISNGISAPSTTFLASAAGISPTEVLTGFAPRASSTHDPVRDGMRIFLPARSAGERTSSSAMWMA